MEPDEYGTVYATYSPVQPPINISVLVPPNDNLTSNSSLSGPENLKFYEIVDILFPTIWGLIVLVGTIGNALVIYVIVAHGERRVTHCYIVNLAITDLTFLLLCIPATMAYHVDPEWIFGLVLCKLFVYFIYVTLVATCLTLTAMTVDRYFAIVHPLRSMHVRTVRLAIGISIAIWLISFAMCIPFIVYSDLKSGYNDPDKLLCQPSWPSEYIGKVQQVVIVIVTYAAPMTVICICYARILWHLRTKHHPKSIKRRTTDAQSCRDVQDRNRRKVTKMIAIVVLLFAISWLPIHVVLTWLAFDPLFPRTPAMYFIKSFANTLSYSNSCINPLVYSFLGDGFRRAFQNSFPGCVCPLPCGDHKGLMANKRSFRGSNRSYGSQRTSRFLSTRNDRSRMNGSFKSRSEVTVCDDNSCVMNYNHQEAIQLRQIGNNHNEQFV